MKKNGNNTVVGDYYFGIDAGTGSSGWAATDFDYKLLKYKGKEMWGARLFETANTAEARRTARTTRRRLERTKQRLALLELLFNNEIAKVDPNFFRRMHDSNLFLEDKTDKSCKYSLFADENYSDADYLSEYPTIYHLRSELIHSTKPHDIRLVFLAIHHILKSRGHFLYESSDEKAGMDLDSSIRSFVEFLSSYDVYFDADDLQAFKDTLLSNDNITNKKRSLKDAYGEIDPSDNSNIDVSSIIELFSGASVQLSKLFGYEELKEAEIKSVSLKDDLDEKYDQLSDILDDNVELIVKAKEIFDIARLNQMLGNNSYISDAKIDLYNTNGKDLKVLKEYVRNNCDKNKYNEIFKYKDKSNNFAKYTNYKESQQFKSCTQEDLCKFLEKELKGMENSENEEEKKIYEKIQNKTFFTKLKGTSNGLIPYQLHLKELKKILDNTSLYLSFLNDASDGISTKDKIISMFTFKIPYYVGPLNQKSDKAFIVRKPDKIYPWNFDEIVDKEGSAENFMKKLIGRCTYTGDEVLPKDSLLYSEYVVLNEINKLKINGNLIDPDTKMDIFEDLFVQSNKKVTKKKIKEYLIANGKCRKEDEISGIDNEVKGKLKSLHDFKKLSSIISDDDIEKIIERIVVYGNDKKMLKNWLHKNYQTLKEDDINQIARMNYKDWGRLSKTFLTKIYHVEKETHEAFSILDMLRDKNLNLMELLSNTYQFAEKANDYKIQKYGKRDSVQERLEDLYIAPSVKRTIWQTLKIVDEVVDIRKAAPSKFFIEMARTSSKELKGKRTETRKDNLLKLYEDCKKQAIDLYNEKTHEKLKGETNQSLRRDKLFLYYTQMGRCMYTGEPIDLEKLLNDNETYDIDHIFPRSRIKDNSLDNRVLVKTQLNRDKTNDYPLTDEIRSKMSSFWHMLHERKLISDKKYERLKRSTPLTDEELSSFIARQLVETQQSTKALATILSEIYPNSKIVYSKAGNVSDFRQEFQIPKFRDVNAFHHAKDAYLNIVVGNVYSTKFTDKFFLNIENENYSLNRVFDYSVSGAWDAPTKDELETFRNEKLNGKVADIKILSGTITTVYKYVFKNTPIITYAPYQQKGELFDVQIMPAGKGQLPIKQNLEINKYGGYNKLTGAYFCVIEYLNKKKKQRGIFPVYLYKVSEYEKDPIRYAEKTLNLMQPEIIINKILPNSILEIEGIRLAITGRSENRILYHHVYQLVITDEKAKYLKELNKYISRHPKPKKKNEKVAPLPIGPHEMISKDGNLKMYDWFISKSRTSPYKELLENFNNNLLECKEEFENSDMLVQAKELIQILNAFICRSTLADLSEIGGPKNGGLIRKSNNISRCKKIVYVNQSVTGLFETEMDLLGE